MTIKEVEERYLKGETICCAFSIRKMLYTISNDSITSKQYEYIVDKYSKTSNFKGDFGGITRHYYTLCQK